MYQAYDEFLEKRDVCAACGAKYVRQMAWGDVRSSFFARHDPSEGEHAALKQARQAKAGATAETFLHPPPPFPVYLVNQIEECEVKENVTWRF